MHEHNDEAPASPAPHVCREPELRAKLAALALSNQLNGAVAQILADLLNEDA
jgi:hypothetical protein